MFEKVVLGSFIIIMICMLGLLKLCELNRDHIHRLVVIVDMMSKEIDVLRSS